MHQIAPETTTDGEMDHFEDLGEVQDNAMVHAELDNNARENANDVVNEEKQDNSSDSEPFYDLYAIVKRTSIYVEDPDKDKYPDVETQGEL